MKIDDAVKELLDTNKLDLYGEIFVIHSLEKGDEGYECLLKKEGRRIIYGHVKKTPTKREAIKEALEQLAMMGNMLY